MYNIFWIFSNFIFEHIAIPQIAPAGVFTIAVNLGPEDLNSNSPDKVVGKNA